MNPSDATAVSPAPHAGFSPVTACWVCGGTDLRSVDHEALFGFDEYREQDPELSRYTGATVALVRCVACGFGQPAALPRLDRFFERMYDQRWSREWMESEFTGGTKDLIFRVLLRELERRLPARRRTLLDVGAHVGRLIHLARERGWAPEGVEVNPRTSGYAREVTGLPVHSLGLRDLEDGGRRFDAVTMIDVLEHIPEPVGALRAAAGLLAGGGWMAVKVPEGRNQLRKEELRARLRLGYRVNVANNLVHVNHFTAGSLRRAMEAAGLTDVTVRPAPPEMPPVETGAVKRLLKAGGPLAVWTAARAFPATSPLTLHLIAYGRMG